ncbi:MAG: NADPH:quinone reductase [Acidobacteria bacterium]|nr:NADPH:quinone reductase [Acidobacteriota bacterium]
MRAIRVRQLGSPEVLHLEEVADPHPGPGEIVVRVHAAGVNPVDVYIRSGSYPIAPPLPYTPGTDAAGTVHAVGKGVRRFAPGDRVYTAGTVSGSYAELALCREPQVHPLPAQITFAQGAAVHIPYATAYRALFQYARAQPGEVALVHGASGGVGIAAVQLARAAGLTVIATAGSEKGSALVSSQGAHHVADHRAPDRWDRIAALAGERGVDIVLEMLANVNLGGDLKLLARRGRVVVVGSRGAVEIDPRDAMSRDASILGMSLLNAPEHEVSAIHRALVAGLENGTLQPVVGREIPLQEAPRSHHAIMEPGAYGKIVLIP